jgi:hypothetical protein
MNEVGGQHAFYLPRLTVDGDVEAWASHGAGVLRQVLALSTAARRQATERARLWSERYDAATSIEGYLTVYRRLLGRQRPSAAGVPALSEEPKA